MLRKKCSLYILRLLAGKFERICTEFPLNTFSRQILKRSPFKFFFVENIVKGYHFKIAQRNYYITSHKNAILIFFLDSLVRVLEKFVPNELSILLNDFVIGFMRDDAKVFFLKKRNDKLQNQTFHQNSWPN